MGNNEAELKRIRMLEKRDEQEAEIRRLCEENNFEIKINTSCST